jgi:nitrite reductase/ring-hydroxylating ferredoxin subunit
MTILLHLTILTAQLPSLMKLDAPAPLFDSRRRFLRQLTLAGAGIALLGLAQACTPDEAEIKACTLAELEQKGSHNLTFNGKQVMLFSREKVITAFSLVCTHKKCTVKWQEENQKFKCPCHKGTYDANGQVVSGPPPRALDRFRTEVRGGDVWVINS